MGNYKLKTGWVALKFLFFVFLLSFSGCDSSSSLLFFFSDVKIIEESRADFLPFVEGVYRRNKIDGSLFLFDLIKKSSGSEQTRRQEEFFFIKKVKLTNKYYFSENTEDKGKIQLLFSHLHNNLYLAQFKSKSVSPGLEGYGYFVLEMKAGLVNWMEALELNHYSLAQSARELKLEFDEEKTKITGEPGNIISYVKKIIVGSSVVAKGTIVKVPFDEIKNKFDI